jgi:hypothetical protein
LPTICAGLLVTGFARLLRSSGLVTVVATLIAPIHAIRLRRRRHNASEHHKRSHNTNASPKLYLLSHLVLLWVQGSFVATYISGSERFPDCLSF